MIHYPVKFRVKFPYDLRNWRLIHETTYNHVRDQRIMQLCALVAKFHKSSPCQVW